MSPWPHNINFARQALDYLPHGVEQRDGPVALGKSAIRSPWFWYGHPTGHLPAPGVGLKPEGVDYQVYGPVLCLRP